MNETQLKFIRVHIVGLLIFLLNMALAQNVPGPTTYQPPAQASVGMTGSPFNATKIGFDISSEGYIETYTLVIKLQNVKAIEMKSVILRTLSKYGTVEINEGLNTLIITDTKEKIENLKSVVAELDKKEYNIRQGLTTEVLVLNYLHPAKIEGFVRSKLSSQGILQVNPELNAFIISEVPSRLEEIKDLIEKLDIPVKQILIKISIIEVEINDAKNIGIDWDNILSSLSLSLNYIPFLNSRIKTSGKTSADYDFSTGVAGLDRNTSINNNQSGNLFSLSLSLDSRQAGDLIKLLLQNGNGRIVSTPRLVAQNNTSASIQAGEEIPYIVNVNNYNTYDSQTHQIQANGDNPEYSIEPANPNNNSFYNSYPYSPSFNYYKNNSQYFYQNQNSGTARSGLLFNVYPHINADQTITMGIIASINSLSGYSPENKPVIFNRNIDTTVSVKNKETFILAGLRRETENKQIKRFPVFGYIPIIKYLFTKEISSIQRSEIVMLITPQIVNENGEIMGQFTIDPNTIQKDLDVKKTKTKSK